MRVAHGHYGEPRLTMDVDIVVHLEAAEANALPEYFPTAEQLLSKFTVSMTSSGSLLQRPLRRFETRLLGRGFTTALDHDRSPLFQSFVAITLVPPPEGWLLRITPWFTSGEDNALVPQPSIDIPRASETPLH